MQDPLPGPDDLATVAPATDASTLVNRATYQIFIVLVTLLSLAIATVYYLVPLPETVDQVLYVVDSMVALVLLYDFFVHLFYAHGRFRYLFTVGWLDLLGALPGVPALRFLRIPSLLLNVRALRRTVPREAQQAARQRLAESALLAVVLVVLVVITFGSIAVVLVEAQSPNANIVTGGDAVWWSIVTVSTVGYGDKYPVTAPGRVIGSGMIVVGVSLFTVLTSYIATQFMARRKGAAPSETEVMRNEMQRAFADLQLSVAAERTALQNEYAELRRLLVDAPNQHPTPPPD